MAKNPEHSPVAPDSHDVSCSDDPSPQAGDAVVVRRALVCTEDLVIDGRQFRGGQVVGEIRDGAMVPTVPGIDWGQLVARFNIGLIAEGTPADFNQGVAALPRNGRAARTQQ